jgi:hypothetical protein
VDAHSSNFASCESLGIFGREVVYPNVAIKEELGSVDRAVEVGKKRLQTYSLYLTSPGSLIGLELFLQFLLDLLGRHSPAAKILQQKLDNE